MPTENRDKWTAPKRKLQAFDTSKIDKKCNSCGWQRQNMDSKVNTTQSSRIE